MDRCIDMNKRNKNGIMLVLILFIIPLVLAPVGNAQVENIWGVSAGDIRTYTYTASYNGTIDNDADYGNYVFSILNIYDNDANDYTELLYTRERVINGEPDLDMTILDDDEGEWDEDDLITYVLDAGEINPLLPIIYNSSGNVGMNWTAQLDYISTIENYTVTITGDEVLIHHWENGEELLTGIPFEIYEYITWDMSTGWLVSYVQRTAYRDPANYDVFITIKRAGGGGLSLDISLLIGIIGVAAGAAAVLLAYLAYRRSRQ